MSDRNVITVSFVFVEFQHRFFLAVFIFNLYAFIPIYLESLSVLCRPVFIHPVTKICDVYSILMHSCAIRIGTELK
jgi:hypothetical protein